MAAGLREHHVSAFPVVDDDGMVIGVVSEADMLPKKAVEEEAPGIPRVGRRDLAAPG
jgi:CBS domain-containing protein